MSIQVKINAVDKADLVEWESFSVQQNISSQPDRCSFSVRKYGSKSIAPDIGDDVKIYDGSLCIFGGTILNINESVESSVAGVVYEIECVDYSFKANSLLASRTYENKTIAYIIDDLFSAYAPGFTTNNVASEFVITKIVFNQVALMDCVKKLAKIVNYDYYIDEDKDLHFFDKFANAAPFNITDNCGKFIPMSLKRNRKGDEIVNKVKVRGAEYDGSLTSDVITVKGSDTKTFSLPYKLADLGIEVDVGAGYVSKNVGIDNIDDFTTDDVLYNYQEKTIRFNSALTDGNKIRWSGKKKVRVFAVANDTVSQAEFDVVEKIISAPDITSNDVARQRATAELYAYANTVIDSKFKTYEPGLRAGMKINIQSTIRGIDDDMIIKTITFKPIDPDNFIYDVDLVSTRRYGFIEILQKLLEPAPVDANDSEVSEEIWSTDETITINEEHDVVTPISTDETITIQESNLLDPVAPASVEFVFGEYVPTSQTDPKRPGRLDVSRILY